MILAVSYLRGENRVSLTGTTPRDVHATKRSLGGVPLRTYN